MRAKTMLTLLFLVSLCVAAMVVLRSLPPKSEAAGREEILVATMPLVAGALLRPQDVAWQAIGRPAERGEIVRPSAVVREAQPRADEEARSEVYGAVLRGAVSAGDPIRRDPVAAGKPIRRGVIVKPGDRDFLQIVLSPCARAIAIPVATGEPGRFGGRVITDAEAFESQIDEPRRSRFGIGASLLYPGDRVDVILTQKFSDSAAPLTRRSVTETVVENLRVLVIDAMDTKMAAGILGRTLTLEVMPDQAEKINVATAFGKLSLTLRSLSGAGGIVAIHGRCSVPWRDVFPRNGHVIVREASEAKQRGVGFRAPVLRDLGIPKKSPSEAGPFMLAAQGTRRSGSARLLPRCPASSAGRAAFS